MCRMCCFLGCRPGEVELLCADEAGAAFERLKEMLASVPRRAAGI